MGLASIDANATTVSTFTIDEFNVEFNFYAKTDKMELETPKPWIYCFSVSCCSFGLFDIEVGTITVCSGDGITAPGPGESFEYRGPVEMTPDVPIPANQTLVTLYKELRIDFEHKFGNSTIVVPAGRYPVKGGTIYVPQVDIF